MTTKTTPQDDTDNNNNNNRDEGTKTNNEEFDEEDNHHKTMTGMEMEMYNNNHITKMAVAHSERDDEHGTEQNKGVAEPES